jgi:hypothetical protein
VPPETIKIKTPKETTEDSEEVSNSSLVIWKAQEKQVLTYLLTSISHDVLVQVVELPTAIVVWKHIKILFASQSRARVINTRMTLATTQNGLLIASEYVSKMMSLADDMVSTRKKTR